MFQQQTSSEIRRNLLSITRSQKLICRLVPEEDSQQEYFLSLSEFSEKVLRGLSPHFPFLISRVHQTLLNIRGRELSSFSPTEQPPPKLKFGEEELLFMAGHLLPDDEDFNVKIPYSFQRKSSFRGFRGSREILYDYRVQNSAELQSIQDSLSPELVSRLVPAQLEVFRLGVERFRAKSWSSAFGFAPTLQDRFWLCLDAGGIVLELESFFSSEKERLARNTALLNISQALVCAISGVFDSQRLEEELAKAFLGKAK